MLVSAVLFLIVAFGSITNAIHPLVSIPQGTLKGYYDRSANGKTIAAFEGVPYARPPVGKYRFREPQPVKPWKGIWEANTLHMCMQYDHFFSDNQNYQVRGDEDCLYLNVYSPQLSQTALQDVVVSIHGGAFMFGYGHFTTPQYLADKDIVLVSLNYRLGVLGFLSTEDAIVPGNNGLKDQNMALKWVRDNIQYFGGNPNSITLVGLSAGGASVQYHMLSPLSAGLFHRAIIMSGCALNNWALTEGGLEKAKVIAHSVGCGASAVKDMVDCMKYRPARQIVGETKLLLKWLYNPFSPFGPVVDSGDLTNAFLPENPYTLLRSGKIHQVPSIMSIVQAEGLYPGAEFVDSPKFLQELEQNWNQIAPFLLDYNYTVAPADMDLISSKIKEKYLMGKPISKETVYELIQLVGDRLFVADIENSARLQANVNPEPVYFYYFTYRGSDSKSRVLSKSRKDFGVCHSDDLNYITSYFTPVLETEDDIAMKDVLVEMWSSFAKTGIPTMTNVNWTPMSKTFGPIDYLHIASPYNITMQQAESLGHREFWNSLPFNENKLTVSIKEEL